MTCLLLIGTCLPAQAQTIATDTVRVADGIVDGSFIKPFTITWASTKTSPEGETQPGNTVEEKVELVEVEGESLLKFSQAWYNPEGQLLYINTQVANPATLAQRRFHSLAPSGGIGHLDFEDTRLQGVAAYTPEEGHLVFDVELPEPLFADGLAGLFVASFPLREGYQVVAPGFGWGGSCSEPCLSWVQFRVKGREEVEVKDAGTVEAWIVEMGQPGSGIQYWVTKEAPYFIKAVVSPSTGGQTSFHIKKWALVD